MKPPNPFGAAPKRGGAVGGRNIARGVPSHLRRGPPPQPYGGKWIWKWEENLNWYITFFIFYIYTDIYLINILLYF